MKKVLFVATLDSHINLFHLPFLKFFKENGYEVHVATNSSNKIKYCDKKIKINIKRSPFNLKNIKAIFELKKIVEEEKYDIIHAHTPMGGVVARIAANKVRKTSRTKVIYTAHGFHFYKGAPLINWVLFYPIEKILANYTNAIITINKEDFNLAKSKFNTKIYYVPGVGINEEKFNIKLTKKDEIELRKSLGLNEEDFVITYPAELNKNKNQIMLIYAMEKLVAKYKNIHLLLPGIDSYNEYYQKIVHAKNLEKNIHFLGFRDDIPKLLNISNLAVSTSLREGLPVNIMEAMYVGLPIIATDCRGNRDLVRNDFNGFLIGTSDVDSLVTNIEKIYNDKKLALIFKKNNNQEIKRYLLDNIMKDMINIYTVESKTKILHLLSSNKLSGAENVVCDIISNLSNDADFIYCSRNGDIKNILLKNNIKFELFNKLNKKEINRIVKKYKPDIIHAHDYKASVIATLLPFKGTIISHLHINSPIAKTYNLKSLLYISRLKKIKKIVGVSNSVLDEAIFKNKIINKYITIYNYVDKEKILKKSQLNCSDYYDLYFIGRLNEYKNPLMFIEIIKKIKEKRNNIKVVMIGDGELKKDCLNLIKEYQLENNIKLVGFVENPFPIIKNSKVCIMPSIYEGFGLTAVESLILDKVVLNSGVGGLAEIFEENKQYICSDIDEYVSKFFKYENIKNSVKIDKFVNKSNWIEKIKKLYMK